jgi:PAS domain S-box-containing protein
MHQRLSRLSVLPHIECLLLDREFVIAQISDGCDRFCDEPDGMSIGRSIFDAFPELFGLEDLIISIIDGEVPSFELKAISRLRPDGTLLYFDLYIIHEEIETSVAQAQCSSVAQTVGESLEPAQGIPPDANGLDAQQHDVTAINAEECSSIAEAPQKLALLFLEDVTNTMSLEQTLVQSSNEMSLVLNKLSASEAYIRQIVTSIGDILLVTDGEGIIRRTNYRFTEVLGMDSDEAIGQPISDFIDASKFDFTAIQSYLSNEDGQILRNVEAYARHRNGSRIVLSFSCSLLQSSDRDRPPEFIYLGRDITTTHYARQRLVTQSTISRTLAEAESLQTALPRLLGGIGMGLDWDIVEFWQPHKTWMSVQTSLVDDLRCEEFWINPGIEASGWSEERYSSSVLGGTSLVGRVWEQKRPIWVADVSRNLQFTHREQARNIFLNTAFLSPLEVDGEAVGVLALLCQDVRSRDPDMMQMLETLSSQIGQFVRRKRAETALRHEQQRTEGLLRNILPEEIAERLKREPSTIADYYEDVTVLFADIVGFTRMSSQVGPHELVRRLNQIFSAFDELSETHGLEKIKTIGDAYMVVGGLPTPREDHASAIAAMALDMQVAIELFNQTSETSISIRIGIHSGPVIAGVIGIKKFIYDLWGDTVNIASRLESHGIAGQIQVSEATRDRVGTQYVFSERGEIDLKGRGSMRTFFLIGQRDPSSPIAEQADGNRLLKHLPHNTEIAELIDRKLRER